ncbi:MAG: N-acetylmuramic acid 6-phosphate etherase [Bacilli bacterium]
MATERRNPRSAELDSLSALEIVSLMNVEDASVAEAVRSELPHIAAAVEQVARALKSGGRLIYVGSGTSGRMGVLDASECPPTFGVSADTVVAVLAGGVSAFTEAEEGAEDDIGAGRMALRALKAAETDVVMGISASGRTPFTIGALAEARGSRAYTVALSCNKNAPLSKEAATAIEVDSGPEVLAGSTRLKAGTAQKMVLNMISTGAMVRSGKVYKNYMVDMKINNEKLLLRAAGILKQVLDVPESTAFGLLEESGYNVKVAIVMALLGSSRNVAIARLSAVEGRVRDAVVLP